MDALIIVVFVLGYLAIALEHPLRINKAATAILTGMLVWTLIMLGTDDEQHLLDELREHLGGVAGILFFLLAAMTVVELMDAHGAFHVITDRITTTSKRRLLWTVGVITFFLSAVLDNLTTTIVMCALLRRLIADRSDLWTFAGLVVIAANAGGAWSPIGDVTTIMLWIDGQITSGNIILKLIAPSLACLLVPLLWMSMRMKGKVTRSTPNGGNHELPGITRNEQLAVFLLGVAALLGVPVFKQYTHLPPFMGILLGLGVLWVYTEFIHVRHGIEERGHLMVTSILRRIDHATILFFLGILLAVAGLESSGHLVQAAAYLDRTLGGIYPITASIGVLSAVVDNVPLVAAAQGMYPMSVFPVDHPFWELIAYCAGTGGSILIIGSAAGVAAMGVLGIDFLWYLRRIAFPALLGYVAGILIFWLLWH